MATAIQNLEVTKGRDFVDYFQIAEGYDITSCTATLVCRNERGGDVTYFTWTSGGGELVLTASGRIRIIVDEATTAAITQTGEGLYELSLTDFDPEAGFDAARGSYPIARGTITLVEAI